MPYDAFEVLGTKAFMATRKAMFRKEVLAALVIVERGLASRKAMRSSWAGALGQPQFLPTSFRDHAVDFDGDGRRDIWNSVPDTLASIANYLVNYGWVKGRDWGFEVTVPDNVSCALEGPDQGRRISEWAAIGIARVGGKPFPGSELRAEGFLLMPAGRSGPAFIVTPNFYVLKEYNESDLYALFIGHGADRIAGGDRRFAGTWGKVGGLYRSDIAALQRGLERIGYDVGGADGLPGFKSPPLDRRLAVKKRPRRDLLPRQRNRRRPQVMAGDLLYDVSRLAPCYAQPGGYEQEQDRGETAAVDPWVGPGPCVSC